jgi:hypothetical protein
MGDKELAWLYETAGKVPEGEIIVEIGAWRGRSSAALYMGANPGVSVISIDTWEGSPDEPAHDIAASKDIQASYLSNMAKLGAEVRPFAGFDQLNGGAYYLKANCLDVARFFPDESILFFFDDGWHSHCGQTIDAWMQKMKSGGLYSGHDYYAFYEDIQGAIHKRFHIHSVEATIWMRFVGGDDRPGWY